MDASWITVWIISFSLLYVVFKWFYVLPLEKAKKAAWCTAILGSLSLTAVLFNVVGQLGVLGGPLILTMWALPSLWVWLNRAEFRGLDQRSLVSLQIFRLIGALFIFEMLRGHIPASFALPAGIGDVLVGIMALTIYLTYDSIPLSKVKLLLVSGLLDFAVAFFFGFTSLPGPAQLFAIGFDNQVNLFPTGLIPFFLVPYALVFHLLSFINLKR